MAFILWGSLSLLPHSQDWGVYQNSLIQGGHPSAWIIFIVGVKIVCMCTCGCTYVSVYVEGRDNPWVLFLRSHPTFVFFFFFCFVVFCLGFALSYSIKSSILHFLEFYVSPLDSFLPWSPAPAPLKLGLRRQKLCDWARCKPTRPPRGYTSRMQ